MREVLHYFALKYGGDFKDIFAALQNKEVLDRKAYSKLKKKAKYVSLVDKNYPEFLKAKEAPPFVLFYEGILDLLKSGLPVKYSTIDSEHRMLSTVMEMLDGDRMQFDYCTACESHEQLTELLEHIKSKV